MKVYSATLSGVKPTTVEVEIDLSSGLPFFQIVGLPDEVLKESKTRVKSAILQSGFDFPYDRRLVLNLAPSQLKKEGSAFELALSAKIIFESHQGQIPPCECILMLGELGLNGSVKLVEELQTLLYSVFLNEVKPDLIVVPKFKDFEFSKLLPCPVVCIESLQDFNTPLWWEKTLNDLSLKTNEIKTEDTILNFKVSHSWMEHFKIAAISNHHYFLCGPPGCGKTFFAETLKFLKQEMNCNLKCDQVEVLNLYFNRSHGSFPWASPHHTTTDIGLIGGGNPPRPGAITKAHGGILFLDEFLEFSPKVLDSLREPLEKGSIEIARAGRNAVFPSKFQLIAATNPCKCGFWKHTNERCRCSEINRKKYQQKLSGPLMDRFDVKLFCKPMRGDEPKVSIKKLILEIKQILEFKNNHKNLNFNFDIESYLKESQLSSIRQYYKIKSLSQTIAHTCLSEVINLEHVEKAQKYQSIREFLE
ncbi:MAG: ATP-binding protein [Oligoflexia bacterium]|nr:ATP-binding protein [Oligoflexia bacterium]